MNIDLLKIKGAFTQEVDKKYELDQDLAIVMKGSIVKHLVGSNQDGSCNITAVFKPVIIEIYEEKTDTESEMRGVE